MPARRGVFLALYRNELEKVWRHRGRALLIVLILFVLGGNYLSYRAYHQQQMAIVQSIAAAKAQVSHAQNQLANAPASKEPNLRHIVIADKQILSQMESQSVQRVNTRQQLHQLQAGLANQPLSARGNTQEFIALDRYRLSHGITSYAPNGNNGLRLVGQIFSTGVMMLIALVAIGISADRMSGEFEGGTWGGLLLHAPYRRLAYSAKSLASITIIWLFMIAAALGFLGGGSLLMGIGNANAPHIVGPHFTLQNSIPPQLIVPSQHFPIIPQWSYDFAAMGLAMFSVGILVLVVMAISIITRSTVISLIAGALLVISRDLAHLVGPLSVLDPAIHLSLIADWTGQLAQQYVMPSLTLPSGILILTLWGGISLLFGLWWSQRQDV